MIEMAKIVHNDYEKISDDLLWFSNNWILKFVVNLNKYNEKFGRQNFHKEISYYKDNYSCININRSFDYYLSIESTKRDDSGYKESVIIRLDDLPILKFRLSKVCEWFTSSENKGLFARKDGKIIILNKVECIKITGLSLDKYLEFEPSIFNSDNGNQIVGVRMYINSDVNSVFLSVNKLLAFNEFIQTFNMYQSAQLMLSYIGRPSNGTNMYDMTTNGNTYNRYSSNNTNKFLK